MGALGVGEKMRSGKTIEVGQNPNPNPNPSQNQGQGQNAKGPNLEPKSQREKTKRVRNTSPTPISAEVKDTGLEQESSEDVQSVVEEEGDKPTPKEPNLIGLQNFDATSNVVCENGSEDEVQIVFSNDQHEKALVDGVKETIAVNASHDDNVEIDGMESGRKVDETADEHVCDKNVHVDPDVVNALRNVSDDNVHDGTKHMSFDENVDKTLQTSPSWLDMICDQLTSDGDSILNDTESLPSSKTKTKADNTHSVNFGDFPNTSHDTAASIPACIDNRSGNSSQSGSASVTESETITTANTHEASPRGDNPVHIQDTKEHAAENTENARPNSETKTENKKPRPSLKIPVHIKTNRPVQKPSASNSTLETEQLTHTGAAKSGTASSQIETRSVTRDRRKEEQIPLLERVQLSLAMTESRLDMEKEQETKQLETKPSGLHVHKPSPAVTPQTTTKERQSRNENKTQALINRDGSLGRKKIVEGQVKDSSGAGTKGGGKGGGGRGGGSSSNRGGGGLAHGGKGGGAMGGSGSKGGKGNKMGEGRHKPNKDTQQHTQPTSSLKSLRSRSALK